MRSLLGTIIWAVGYFRLAIPFWLEEFLLKDQLLSLWESLCVICCFSLTAFNICSVCLIFFNFINMYLGVFRLGFILIGSLWVSWIWVAIFFPILWKFSTIISSSIFSWSFFFVFFFWDSYDLNVGTFNIVPEVSEVVLFF